MVELDFERKHEEDLQRLRGFRLLDDVLQNRTLFLLQKRCIKSRIANLSY